jgi:catechol 2,3-dioxygenase-like lactoylglutathione lyase family enzyme
MKPRITVITLGVDDLERALRFYRDGLGLPTQGIVGTEFEHGAVPFFDLHHGLKLAIWPRTSLAHEAKVPPGPRSATEFALGHNVGSKAELDAVMAKVKNAERRSPIRRTMPSGAATPARSKIPMGMSGKRPGIRIGNSPTSRAEKKRCQPPSRRAASHFAPLTIHALTICSHGEAEPQRMQ